MAKKPKTQDLPEMTGPGVGKATNKLVEKAAELYVEARDARMAAMKPEADAKAVLLAEMHKDHLSRYEFDDFIITLEAGKETLKVKKAGADDITGEDNE